MSTRKQSSRNRAFRPAADDLETRQLLSGVVTGRDIDGDLWTLRLVGPGAISVTKQNDASGNPTTLMDPSEINTITIGGTDPTKSQLIGTVTRAAGGDGEVFFETLNELPSLSEHFAGVGQGLLAINMPGFWLGNTYAAGTTPTSSPSMHIPDGTDTLRFGGVDTTHNPVTPTSTSTSDNTEVELGLPMFGGTRVEIDKSISSTQQAPPASGSTTTTTIQHMVTFAVSGRLQLFQANEIDGDATNPPGQFTNENSAASGSGGTEVVSTLASVTPFFTTTTSGVVKGAVGGQIGFVQVGGNATNFTTLVEDPTGTGIAHISNFYVGGETNNVMLIAPDGANTLVFGKGMDTVEIRAHVINQLKANRGAIDSNVAVDRQIGLVDLGGPVVNTKVLSGYAQDYTGIINTVTGTSTSVFSSATPAAPPIPTDAQTAGKMTVHVGGDITNSIFAASTAPDTSGAYGSPGELLLPTGQISAKVEGTIDNATATPDSPSTAFYAQKVALNASPVAPAGVAEEPYAHYSHSFLPGVPATPVTVGHSTPKGPTTTKK